MMGYLGHFVSTSEQDMINNSYNTRQQLLISQNYRGKIFSADGEVLAQTIQNEDGSETRSYPYDNLFAHVVGFSTQGRTGVEAAANYYLINSNIPVNQKVANDIAGTKNPGDDVYTTLDVSLQEVASRALGVYKGSVIVTEVATGKILAMVSKPDFNPNEIQEIWGDLVEDSESSVLLNRATQGLYPPGSTFKMITALQYIRENPDTYQDYQYQCNGRYTVDGSSIRCYHGTNHGSVDFTMSFAKSCNGSFANIGMGLDKEKFNATLGELLFNQELPITMNYSKSSTHITDDMEIDEMMQTSIGQGKTLMTPIHLNMITGAIANKGILMKPYVVDRVENNGKNVIKKFSSSSYGRLITEEEAEILRQMMSDVVTRGTSTVLSGQSYTVAGKTGSAEYNASKDDSHAWFTGFAPAENPEISVTLIIEGAGSGGEYAVPIAKRIFDAYFEE